MRGQADFAMIARLQLDEVRTLKQGDEVFDGPKGVIQLLVAGVVGEIRLLGDGRRQILALRLPGDFLAPAECERLVALTGVRLADGAPLMACLADPCESKLPLRLAWHAAARADQAILRDQVVRLGRMSAFERVAHLLLEVHERLAQVDLTAGANFHLPLTQEMLSDVVGLSVVHLNRTLQTLRRSGLIMARHGHVTLVDRPQLVEIASYVSRFPVAWRANQPAASTRAEMPNRLAC